MQNKWATIPTIRAHLPSSFLVLDLHLTVHKLPCVTLGFVGCVIMSQPLDLTNEIDGQEFITCAYSRIGGPGSTKSTRAFHALDPTTHELARRQQKM